MAFGACRLARAGRQARALLARLYGFRGLMDRLVRGGAGSARTEGMWSFANSAFHQTIMLITAIDTSIGRLATSSESTAQESADSAWW
jgi:hypothetical protein